MRIFRTYSWPGNLREMRNIVKRATLLCMGSLISKTCLPPELEQKPVEPEKTSTTRREMEIELIKDAGVKVGVSIKPATPVNDISHLLEDVDMVLIMTVQPGFGGQKYLAECTEKIEELKEIIDREELNVDIEVDGGINDETIETAMKAGANVLVAGSYVFNGNLESNVHKIQKRMQEISEKID